MLDNQDSRHLLEWGTLAKEGLMFDEVLRELRKLEQGVKVSVEVQLDDNGYYDRLCPSKKCSNRFKVLFQDWRDKVSDERVFCPFCRRRNTSSNWNTPEQQEYFNQAALAHASDVLGRALSSGARRFNEQQSSRPRGGLIDISMSMQYKPGRPIIAVPPASAESLRQEFECAECCCHWSSLGASYFCPACGYNSVEMTFDTTLTMVRTFLASIPSMRRALESGAGSDAAETTIRQLLEDQFGRVIGALERLCESLFCKVPNASSFAKHGNVFQRIPEASRLWQQAVGKCYEELISPSEVAELNRFVQQRHVLGHKQGIVDERYIERSGDIDLRPGQRLVVRAEHVERLVAIVSSLSNALRLHLAAQQ